MNRIPGLALFLALFVSCVAADQTDLRDGMFVVHYAADLPYSSDPPPEGWCGVYAQHAISSLDEQVVRVDLSDEETPIGWFVLAAWTEEKTWCGTEFGLGDYDTQLFHVTDFEACYPAGGGLQISSPDWPAANTGTAIVTTGGAWSGNLVPVYFFGGYAYTGFGSGLVPIDVDPNYEDPAQYFAGFSNCANPPEPFEAECLGGLGIDMDGIRCGGVPPVVGACCWGDSCEILTLAECMAASGSDWHAGYTSCEPNPCEGNPAVEGCTWGRIKAIYR